MRRWSVTTASSPSLSESIHLGEDRVSSNPIADLERPLGRKVKKEWLNKRETRWYGPKSWDNVW